MDDLKNILKNNNGQLPEDMLLAYLEGTLPPAQQYEVEQWLSEEGMESDAIDGLKTLNPTDTKHAVNRLNHNLRKELLSKKRNRRYINNTPYGWLAIALVLLLAALAYIVVHMAVKR